MIKKEIIYFGQKSILGCDNKCHKAWGLNNRPKIVDENNIHNVIWLSDNQIEEDAPINPGTIEGWDSKPTCDEEKLNKWCARECERSKIVKINEKLILTDWSKRLYNIPQNG